MWRYLLVLWGFVCWEGVEKEEGEGEEYRFVNFNLGPHIMDVCEAQTREKPLCRRHAKPEKNSFLSDKGDTPERMLTLRSPNPLPSHGSPISFHAEFEADSRLQI